MLFFLNTTNIQEVSKEEGSIIDINWIRIMITDFLALSNMDKGLDVIKDDFNDYIYKRKNELIEYIMQLHIGRYFLEEDLIFTFRYDNTRAYGKDEFTRKEFDFEKLIQVLANIDAVLNERY